LQKNNAISIQEVAEEKSLFAEKDFVIEDKKN